MASYGGVPLSIRILSPSKVHPLVVISAFHPLSLGSSELNDPVVSAMPHTSNSLGLWHQSRPISSTFPSALYNWPMSIVIVPGNCGLPLPSRWHIFAYLFGSLFPSHMRG